MSKLSPQLSVQAFLLVFLVTFFGFGDVFFVALALGLAFFLSAAFLAAGDFLGETGFGDAAAVVPELGSSSEDLTGDAFFLGEAFFLVGLAFGLLLLAFVALVVFLGLVFLGDFFGLWISAEAVTSSPLGLLSSEVDSTFLGDEDRAL